ncbi:GTPase IMAP family member 8-like [Labeo rohita]|uniref:GTPase IMAP family member 8-like n=1 Tax=Labeo rohita TaxID=84645 RepID=UPI0021E342D2|nr:GTPase IMAP family member 8-like [Labeo rohita]
MTDVLKRSALSYIRIVLVGKTGSGKSSTGNTILFKENFKQGISAVSVTKICEKAKEKIGDRTISITDTPGLFDTTMSKQDLKKEIENCVDKSAPGPHAFLLVIRVGRFTMEEKNAVKWIQENFGEEAAPYTIILFTHADQLKGISLDEYISESNDLKALVRECGDRFHSFNNEDMRNRSQVTELLKKIDMMVKNNGGQCYTNTLYQKAQKKKKFCKWLGKPQIVLLGKTGSGKTCTKNTIAVQESLDRRNLRDYATENCEVHVDGKSMTIIDISEMDEIKNLLMSASGPLVFLLVIRLDRFTYDEKNTVKWIKKNFGEVAANYTIILFTHGDHLNGNLLDKLISERNDLQALVNECGGRYHSFNNNDMSNQYQVTELLKKIEMTMEKNEWKHYTSDMYKKDQAKIQDRAKFWSGKPRIVLLGKTGSGNTRAAETIVGQRFTKTYEKQEACVDGKKMKIINTPELIDGPEEKIKNEIKKLVYISDPGPHVFLLVIKLGEMFREENNIVRFFQENIGEQALCHSIILFTHADHLRGISLDEYIRERPYLQSLVHSCGGRFHSFSNQRRNSQVTDLLEKIENTAEMNGWKYFTNEMFENILNDYLCKLRNIALTVGPLGTAGIVAGGIVLGVTEIVAAPITLIVVGSVALLLSVNFQKFAERFELYHKGHSLCQQTMDNGITETSGNVRERDGTSQFRMVLWEEQYKLQRPSRADYRDSSRTDS